MLQAFLFLWKKVHYRPPWHFPLPRLWEARVDVTRGFWKCPEFQLLSSWKAALATLTFFLSEAFGLETRSHPLGPWVTNDSNHNLFTTGWLPRNKQSCTAILTCQKTTNGTFVATSRIWTFGFGCGKIWRALIVSVHVSRHVWILIKFQALIGCTRFSTIQLIVWPSTRSTVSVLGHQFTNAWSLITACGLPRLGSLADTIPWLHSALQHRTRLNQHNDLCFHFRSMWGRELGLICGSGADLVRPWFFFGCALFVVLQSAVVWGQWRWILGWCFLGCVFFLVFLLSPRGYSPFGLRVSGLCWTRIWHISLRCRWWWHCFALGGARSAPCARFRQVFQSVTVRGRVSCALGFQDVSVFRLCLFWPCGAICLVSLAAVFKTAGFSLARAFGVGHLAQTTCWPIVSRQRLLWDECPKERERERQRMIWSIVEKKCWIFQVSHHCLIQGSGQWLCGYGRFIAHAADLGICREAPEKRHARTGASVQICE